MRIRPRKINSKNHRPGGEAMLWISADIQFTNGNLKGIVIPSGFSTMVANWESWERMRDWVTESRRIGLKIRATGTGDTYTFVSAATLTDEPSDGSQNWIRV